MRFTRRFSPPFLQGSFSPEVLLMSIAKYFASSALLFCLSVSLHAQTTGAVLTRHAPNLNRRVEGSVQQMLGEGLNLNNGADVTGELLVPGSPEVQTNGQPAFGGV